MLKLDRIDYEIECDFVREFSVHGAILYPSSVDDRRERIRTCIYNELLQDQPFHDYGMTYREAYERCYSRPLEMRRVQRHPPKT